MIRNNVICEKEVELVIPINITDSLIICFLNIIDILCIRNFHKREEIYIRGYDHMYNHTTIPQASNQKIIIKIAWD